MTYLRVPSWKLNIDIKTSGVGGHMKLICTFFIINITIISTNERTITAQIQSLKLGEGGHKIFMAGDQILNFIQLEHRTEWHPYTNRVMLRVFLHLRMIRASPNRDGVNYSLISEDKNVQWCWSWYHYHWNRRPIDNYTHSSRIHFLYLEFQWITRWLSTIEYSLMLNRSL